MSRFVFSTRVAYPDIDEDLRLTMTGAIRMMQEAAILHSSQAGYSVTDAPRTGLGWMLVSWRVRMTGQAHWNDDLDVTTWPRTMEKLTSDRCFRITDRSGREVAVGESCWLMVSVDTGKMIRIPPQVVEAYDLTPDTVFDEPMPRLGNQVGELTFSCTAQRRDLDTNRHVNNLVYLDYARQSLPEDLADQAFSEVAVRYHRQILLGDPVRCYYLPVPQGHLIQICGKDPHHIHGTVLFTP